MPLPPEMETFFARFENLFQRFWHGQDSTRPMNEEIERVYRHLPHRPKNICPHGKSRLICEICYFSEERGK